MPDRTPLRDFLEGHKDQEELKKLPGYQESRAFYAIGDYFAGRFNPLLMLHPGVFASFAAVTFEAGVLFGLHEREKSEKLLAGSEQFTQALGMGGQEPQDEVLAQMNKLMKQSGYRDEP